MIWTYTRQWKIQRSLKKPSKSSRNMRKSSKIRIKGSLISKGHLGNIWESKDSFLNDSKKKMVSSLWWNWATRMPISRFDCTTFCWSKQFWKFWPNYQVTLKQTFDWLRFIATNILACLKRMKVISCKTLVKE